MPRVLVILGAVFFLIHFKYVVFEFTFLIFANKSFTFM
mgnify:CR=1 FL=1